MSRELDVQIAERLFGRVRCRSEKAHSADYPNTYCYAQPANPTQGGEVELFSSTGDGMLAVIEEMQRRGWWFSLRCSEPEEDWDVTLTHLPADDDGDQLEDIQVETGGATAPEAVARAALAAIQEKP